MVAYNSRVVDRVTLDALADYIESSVEKEEPPTLYSHMESWLVYSPDYTGPGSIFTSEEEAIAFNKEQKDEIDWWNGKVYYIAPGMLQLWSYYHFEAIILKNLLAGPQRSFFVKEKQILNYRLMRERYGLGVLSVPVGDYWLRERHENRFQMSDFQPKSWNVTVGDRAEVTIR